MKKLFLMALTLLITQTSFSLPNLPTPVTSAAGGVAVGTALIISSSIQNPTLSAALDAVVAGAGTWAFQAVRDRPLASFETSLAITSAVATGALAGYTASSAMNALETLVVNGAIPLALTAAGGATVFFAGKWIWNKLRGAH